MELPTNTPNDKSIAPASFAMPADAASETPAPEALSPVQEQMNDVGSLIHELRKLLVKHEAALGREGIQHQVETLERWLESYRHGLSAAHKISDNGTVWLNDFRDRLKLAADELQRLEGEGGNTAPSKEQAAEADELLNATRRIDRVVPVLEKIFRSLAEEGDVVEQETQTNTENAA